MRMGLGGYIEERILAADRAVKLPDAISDEQAGAMMLKGMTACYLLRRTYKVEKGNTILVHAAAGGVGLLLCQWAKHIGATVIGTVGSKEKAELARANGCDHPILYRDEDFAARVKDITNGKLCHVVYDGIGKATYPGSWIACGRFGMFVNFGAASGAIEDFDLNSLAPKGSLFATRPTLATHIAKREDLLELAHGLFDVVASGAVKIEINQKYPLKDAARRIAISKVARRRARPSSCRDDQATILRAAETTCHSGMRRLAQARNPYSRRWLWIPARSPRARAPE